MNWPVAIVIVALLGVVGWMYSTSDAATQTTIWEWFVSIWATLIGGGAAGGIAGFVVGKKASN